MSSISSKVRGEPLLVSQMVLPSMGGVTSPMAVVKPVKERRRTPRRRSGRSLNILIISSLVDEICLFIIRRSFWREEDVIYLFIG